MNLSLIDPFILAQDYPDALTGKLSESPELRIQTSTYRDILKATQSLVMPPVSVSIAKETSLLLAE